MSDEPKRVEQLDELLAVFRDGELNESQLRALDEILREDPNARRYYAEYVDMCASLKRQHGGLDTTPDDNAAEGNPVPLSTQSENSQPVTRDQIRPVPAWGTVLLAVAACMLLMCGGWYLISGDDNPPPEIAMIPPADPPKVTTVGNWKITPTGNASFEVLQPTLVRLDRGELLVESWNHNADNRTMNNTAPEGSDSTSIRIQTPQGEATAVGTKFYIGTHVLDNSEEHAMNSLTRVLVMAGVVTLNTVTGSVDGTTGDLLLGEADKEPTKLAVQANTDFAFDLYAKLAKEHEGKNVFFSPYSISSAIAMVAEGARGQTAAEIGNMLRFPAEMRRHGVDSQLIPWETSMMHNGMEKLNELLNTGDHSEGHKALVAEIEALKLEIAELDKQSKTDDNLVASVKAFKVAQRIDELLSRVPTAEISVANAIWGDQSYEFSRDYAATLRRHYAVGGIFPVDFRNDYATARRQINQWCAEQTRDRITNVMPARSQFGSIEPRMVMTNAIYFKAEWKEPFCQENTELLPFKFADSGEADTPIMHADGLKSVKYAAFNGDGTVFDTPDTIEHDQKNGLYPAAEGFAMAELPYRGDDLSMILIAPNTPSGLVNVEANLTAENVARWIDAMKKRETNVYLPKFKLETTYQLDETLRSLGMRTAFTESANFNGMLEPNSPSNGLYLGSVRHKAFVEVDERGTEAAGLTSSFMLDDASFRFVPEFRADRPFIYLIREKSTGTILFMGRMMNPAEG